MATEAEAAEAAEARTVHQAAAEGSGRGGGETSCSLLVQPRETPRMLSARTADGPGNSAARSRITEATGVEVGLSAVSATGTSAEEASASPIAVTIGAAVSATEEAATTLTPETETSANPKAPPARTRTVTGAKANPPGGRHRPGEVVSMTEDATIAAEAAALTSAAGALTTATTAVSGILRVPRPLSGTGVR